MPLNLHKRAPLGPRAHEGLHQHFLVRFDPEQMEQVIGVGDALGLVGGDLARDGAHAVGHVGERQAVGLELFGVERRPGRQHAIEFDRQPLGQFLGPRVGHATPLVREPAMPLQRVGDCAARPGRELLEVQVVQLLRECARARESGCSRRRHGTRRPWPPVLTVPRMLRPLAVGVVRTPGDWLPGCGADSTPWGKAWCRVAAPARMAPPARPVNAPGYGVPDPFIPIFCGRRDW